MLGIKVIQSFQTSDGEEFENEQMAIDHQAEVIIKSLGIPTRNRETAITVIEALSRFYSIPAYDLTLYDD